MASDKALMGIGEVSSLTGVNPVTLRAWQRRYGLIVPQRTPKGHRLYSTKDVENINEILTWLDRGVAISQVKSLMGTQTVQVKTGAVLEETHKIFKAIESFDITQVNRLLALTLKEYPFTVVKSRLILPIERKIDDSQYQVRELYKSVWRSAIVQTVLGYLSKKRKDLVKRSCTLISLDDSPDYSLALIAYELSLKSYDVTFLLYPCQSLRLIAGSLDKEKPMLLAVHSDKALTTGLLNEVEKINHSTNFSLRFTGKCVDIHADVLCRLQLD
ncbi:MerR family transcriptional regulator [Veronia pacifica]|uniref:HTH merR-type domain-containing protein n=1 Tax=Veronia pacifica TaxID=1080227 RepID=A0A1C3EMY4_9GAMM|nr:MerR family transcriptional regulator [Veronia pacifica]ODA34569.1 hypothetical protein A8L45_06265 [Veronia pacifica]